MDEGGAERRREGRVPARTPRPRLGFPPVSLPWLLLDELPEPGCNRWTPKRKACVAHAVQAGRIAFDDARAAYGLSVEELHGWMRLFQRFGLRGLKATERIPAPALSPALAE